MSEDNEVIICSECNDTGEMECPLCDVTGNCSHCGQDCPDCEGFGVIDCDQCDA